MDIAKALEALSGSVRTVVAASGYIVVLDTAGDRRPCGYLRAERGDPTPPTQKVLFELRRDAQGVFLTIHGGTKRRPWHWFLEHQTARIVEVQRLNGRAGKLWCRVVFEGGKSHKRRSYDVPLRGWRVG